MTIKAHTRFLVGLGCGLVLAGIGAAAWWPQGSPYVSPPLPVIPSALVESPTDLGTYEDMAALTAKVERQFADIQRELTVLQAQRPQVEQTQVSSIRNRTRHSERGAYADRRKSDSTEQNKDAAAQALILEAESERAEAYILAQVEMIEGTLHTEATDPKWASPTEDALYEAFHNVEIPGVQFVQAECRTTLCRLDLSLDSSMSSGESVQRLLHLTSWQGQRFMRMTAGESPEAVVYLAREGYALPQGGSE